MIRRSHSPALFLLLASLLASLAAAARLQATDLMPLESVRPGMIGVGRTVFEGSRVDEFQVHILGVLPNVGPKQSVILARLEGGPLAHTGVISGMSGSPVLVSGRLVGAVAYSFPFAKDTIAGITPIEEMIDPARGNVPSGTPARASLPYGPDGPLRALDFTKLSLELTRRAPSHASALDLSGALIPDARGFKSLSPPLVFTGFDARAYDWARMVFSGLGFLPVLGSGASAGETLPNLEPGGAVGFSLVEGDLDLTVTGTITHIDGENLYAFGHSFYNLGPTQFPMKKAYVYSVVPSFQQSWKISAVGDLVGTFEQDRSAVVVGRLGKTPRMIPIDVRFKTSGGQDRLYSFRIVEDDLLSPLLAYVSLRSVLQANERSLGVSTMRVTARLTLDDDRKVFVDDMIAANGAAEEAAALVATPMAYILSNEFERARAARIDVQAEAEETLRTAHIERVWLDSGGPIRAGERRTLRIRLRAFRGDAIVETVPLDLPPSLRPGLHALHVMDAESLTRYERAELRRAFVPRSLEQIIRAINGIRRNNRLHVRLIHSSAGAVIAGEPMPSLPPSIIEVLRGPTNGSDVVPLRSAAVWSHDLPTSYVTRGSQTLWLTIEQ
ncbi:MAG: hypothetical protein JXO72_12505 [Vicinamibacteria bacterium]|nr:hypothetical protein [Vicinamibacteria bacterium]